ncbi:MAG: hypothetical protein R6V60_10930, partial [Desulfobacterales bacterium]
MSRKIEQSLRAADFPTVRLATTAADDDVRTSKRLASGYRLETLELLHNRVGTILWVGVVLYPLFTLLDFVVARQHFALFGAYRIVFALFCLLLLFLLHF